MRDSSNSVSCMSTTHSGNFVVSIFATAKVLPRLSVPPVIEHCWSSSGDAKRATPAEMRQSAEVQDLLDHHGIPPGGPMPPAHEGLCASTFLQHVPPKASLSHWLSLFFSMKARSEDRADLKLLVTMLCCLQGWQPNWENLQKRAQS